MNLVQIVLWTSSSKHRWKLGLYQLIFKRPNIGQSRVQITLWHKNKLLFFQFIIIKINQSIKARNCIFQTVKVGNASITLFAQYLFCVKSFFQHSLVYDLHYLLIESHLNILNLKACKEIRQACQTLVVQQQCLSVPNISLIQYTCVRFDQICNRVRWFIHAKRLTTGNLFRIYNWLIIIYNLMFRAFYVILILLQLSMQITCLMWIQPG